LLAPKLEMNVVLGNNLGHIKANEGYIGQVLLNLVVNANDAMPDGGELKIETSLAILDEDDVRRPPDATIGTYVVLCIADTGSGMTDDVKTHLFDAFFTTKSIGHGTGLGLTTCQSIVQQSGGFIAVLSQVDVGTTFTIYFPQFVEETITAN
jgi:signal transduction histidine kinase